MSRLISSRVSTVAVPALLNSLVCSGSLSLITALLSESAQTSNGGLSRHCCSRGEHVGSASDLPVRGLAFPDAGSDSPDRLLAAEAADVLAADSNLLCSLCHYYLIFNPH